MVGFRGFCNFGGRGVAGVIALGLLVAATAVPVPQAEAESAGLAGSLPPGGTFTDDNGNIHEPNIEAIAADGPSVAPLH